MNKTKWMMVAFLALAVTALSFGLVALFRQSSVQALGPSVPQVIALLPENANFVAFVDIRKILYSPVYKTFENEHGDKFTSELQEFIRLTGMDPRNDLESIAFASFPGPEGSGNVPVAVISGRFNKEKINALITSKVNPDISQYKGITLYSKRETVTPNEKGSGTEVVGFLDDTKMLFGKRAAIEAVVDATKGERAGVVANPAFVRLLNQTSTDGTFWVVGTDVNFLNRFRPQPSKEAKGKAPSQSIFPSVPPIENFIIHGDLGSMISLTLRTECSNEKSAQNVNDFLRGIIALGKLTLEQRPEMAGILGDIQVQMDKKLVSLTIQMPFEDLKKLHELKKGAETAAPLQSKEKL